jgi:hypothetical protein
MLSGIAWNRTVVIAAFAAFFSVLALNLTVPVVVVSVMGLVDRALMRIWFGPPLWNIEEKAI